MKLGIHTTPGDFGYCEYGFLHRPREEKKRREAIVLIWDARSAECGLAAATGRRRAILLDELGGTEQFASLLLIT
jgi:hypothetical protein